MSVIQSLLHGRELPRIYNFLDETNWMKEGERKKNSAHT